LVAAAGLAAAASGCRRPPLSATTATDGPAGSSAEHGHDAGRGGPDVRTDTAATEADAGSLSEGGAPDAARADTRDAGPDAGSDADQSAMVSLPSGRLVPVSGTLDALAIDGDGVYWVTVDNQPWALDAGSSTPRPLAPAAGLSVVCLGTGRLAAAGDALFWTATRRDDTTLTSELHRTEKRGTDVVLVAGLVYADPADVVVDAEHVYWNEGTGSNDGRSPGALVRAIARDAAPGTAPRTLISVSPFDLIAEVAIIGQTLYWVDVGVVGTTVFIPGTQSARLDLLWAGQSAGAFVATAWLVRGYRGDLYGSHRIDLWHQALLRIPGDRSPSVDLAPIDGADEIVFIDDWALVSQPSDSCGNPKHALVAISITQPGTVVHFADDLATPVLLGDMLVFGDGHGQLHLVPPDDLRATLLAATRGR